MNLIMIKQSAMCLFTTVYLVKMLMSVSALNLKLFYASVKFSECQICMIRDKCFDCNQKEHTQKSCLMHSFKKIHLLLNLKINQSMNSVSQTDMKINMKSSASFTMKIMKSVSNLIAKHIIISWMLIMITEITLIMKLIMKLTVKSVTNMNMYINLNENIQTVFIKKIYIILSVIS